MSVADASIRRQDASEAISPLLRLAVAIVATGIVALGLAVLGYLLFTAGVSAPAARNPFATGPGLAPMASGVGGFILTVQAHFYAALTAAVQAMKAEGTGVMPLATIGFLYGVFHAAGPGHGKGVISGYIVATDGSIRHGLALSLAAALLQAVVAIAVVGVFAVLLKSTAASINATARIVELASFAAVAALGAVLLWSKAGAFIGVIAPGGSAIRDRSDVSMASGIGGKDWRVLAGVILAAGIRPCSGAIILLVFALSQGLFAAGVVGALAMAFGTSITTGTLASLTVFAKALVKRLAKGRGMMGFIAFAGFELLAAAFVLMLGTILFTGIWIGGLPGALD